MKKPLLTAVAIFAGAGALAATPKGPSGASVVSPSLDLATDVGFTPKTKQLERTELRDYELPLKTVAVRESFIVGVGPAKPFVGFGAGVAIVPWTFTQISTGAELDSRTEVKAAFGIPFGCEFRLTPNVALGARAEYLVITGEAAPEVRLENVRTFTPDPFLLTAVARVDF